MPTILLYSAEAYASLKGRQRKAMADQIATVSKLRLRRRIGHLSMEDVDAIAHAVKLQLDL